MKWIVVSFFLAFVVGFFLAGCGHEPNPVVDALVTQAGPGLEGDQQIVDGGTPDAGCSRHAKSHGHGQGLEKHCD